MRPEPATGSDEWVIRAAEKSDAAAIVTCINAAYRQYEGRIADLPPVAEGIADDIRDNLVWVIENDRGIAGVAIVARADDHATLSNLAVDPLHAGKKLGRGLINHAERAVKALGYDEIQLTTHAGIPDNIALYTHLGWRRIGGSGNRVFMTKKL